MNKLKLWIYKRFHLNDDYSVRATKCDDIRENYHTFSTPWFFKAVKAYIHLHVLYPECTIVFTHHKYK